VVEKGARILKVSRPSNVLYGWSLRCMVKLLTDV
jgi:hypothetical protein